MTSQRLAPTPKIRSAVKATASAVDPKATSAVDSKAKVSVAAPKTPPILVSARWGPTYGGQTMNEHVAARRPRIPWPGADHCR